VIAQPNPIANTHAAAEAANPLTEHELHQLTLYKWRYSLEAYGFDAGEVRELVFLKWLHESQRVQP
jgi:hypothetical protein